MREQGILLLSSLGVISLLLSGCDKVPSRVSASQFGHEKVAPEVNFDQDIRRVLRESTQVDIWEGTFEIENPVKRRDLPLVPPLTTCHSGDGSEIYGCRVGGVNPSFGRSEIVVDPMYLKGKMGDSFGGTHNVDGMVYPSPETGKFVWVAVVRDDTDALIRRQFGPTLSDLTSDQWLEMRSKAQVAIADLESDPKKPKVIAVKENGTLSQIISSKLSGILGIFGS